METVDLVDRICVAALSILHHLGHLLPQNPLLHHQFSNMY